jgi:hypothetical protein
MCIAGGNKMTRAASDIIIMLNGAFILPQMLADGG